MQSVYFMASTDSNGFLYYPKTYTEAESTHKLSATGEQTYVFRFSNGQDCAITSSSLLEIIENHPVVNYWHNVREIGPEIDLNNIPINPYLAGAINFRQVVNNGETLPVYTSQEVQSIIRGEELIAQWAQESFEENLKRVVFIANHWNVIAYTGQTFICTVGIITTPAHAGARAFLACTPLLLHFAKDAELAAFNALEGYEALTEEQATYLKSGAKVKYAIAGFFVGDLTSGGSAVFDAVDFIAGVGEGIVGLANVSTETVQGGHLQYLKTTWNYTPHGGPSGQVEMFVYAKPDSSIINYIPAILAVTKKGNK